MKVKKAVKASSSSESDSEYNSSDEEVNTIYTLKYIM